jgi:hypothetical protein
MNIVLSKDALIRVDQFRKARGIRTRKAAVEAMLAVVPVELEEHPLDVKLREARANPSDEKIPARVKQSFTEMRQARANGTLQTVSHAEMMERLQRRKNVNSQ